MPKSIASLLTVFVVAASLQSLPAATAPALARVAPPYSRALADTTPAPARRLSERELRQEIRREQRALQRSRSRGTPSDPELEREAITDGASGGFGIAALGVGAFGLLLSVVASIVVLPAPIGVIALLSFPLAIIFGAMGMKRRRHRGLAIAGFVIGVVMTALILIVFVAALIAFS